MGIRGEIEKITKGTKVSFFPRYVEKDKTYYTLDDDSAESLTSAIIEIIKNGMPKKEQVPCSTADIGYNTAIDAVLKEME